MVLYESMAIAYCHLGSRGLSSHNLTLTDKVDSTTPTDKIALPPHVQTRSVVPCLSVAAERVVCFAYTNREVLRNLSGSKS